MTQSQPIALIQDWRSWDGRIVNGKYPLLQFLADSAGTAVYLTEIDGTTAVIKLLATEAANAQVASWKLAARLSHPNLVRVFDTGLWHADDEHDLEFAVMEYCEETLDAVLRQRPLTPDDARQMLLPTLEALKYLHHQGIAHGQLNPASVLASGDQLKLAIDHLRQRAESAPDSVTTFYASPEKASGTISPGSDIFALGLMLHEALTRRLPARNQDGTVEITERFSSPFDEIVRQCLTSDRERRPSLAAIGSLLERPAPVLVTAQNLPTRPNPAPPADIAMVRSDASISARQPAVSEERSWSRLKIVPKHPALAAAVALVLLLAVLIGVWRGRENKAASPSPSSFATQKSAPAASATRSGSEAHAGSAANPSHASGSVLHQAIPEIPERVRRTINGTVKVTVKVAVTAEGKVSRAALSAHGPSAYFARQAVDAAEHWTFAPPMHDGKPQASDWMLHFEFRSSGTRAAAQRV